MKIYSVFKPRMTVKAGCRRWNLESQILRETWLWVRRTIKIQEGIYIKKRPIDEETCEMDAYTQNSFKFVELQVTNYKNFYFYASIPVSNIYTCLIRSMRLSSLSTPMSMCFTVMLAAFSAVSFFRYRED